MDYKEVTETIEVPPHTGVEGMLLAIRKVLKLSRVTQVNLDVVHGVTYTRYVRPEEPRKNIEVDFDSVTPSALVRNIEIQEVDVFSLHDNAAACLAAMFYAAAVDHMHPVAFVTGANTTLYSWHGRTTGVRIVGDSVYGLPLFRDRFLPDDALLLVTAFARSSGLIDGQKSYKISMPGRQALVQVGKDFEIVSPETSAESDFPLVAAGPPPDDDVKVMP